jgi:hypothetical protein
VSASIRVGWQPAKSVEAYRRDPSLKRAPQLQGSISPDLRFFMRTTGLRMPGTAAEATVKIGGLVRLMPSRHPKT